MRRRLTYENTPGEIEKAKDAWLAKMQRQNNMGLEVMDPGNYLVRKYLYDHRDVIGKSFFTFGLAVMGMASMGHKGILSMFILVAIERLYHHSQEFQMGVGVSGMFSGFSGYMIATSLLVKGTGWAPFLVGWFIALFSLYLYIRDPTVDEEGRSHIAHIKGHFIPTCVGIVLAVLMKNVKI